MNALESLTSHLKTVKVCCKWQSWRLKTINYIAIEIERSNLTSVNL